MCALIRFLCFMGMKIFFYFCKPSLLLSWMFEHDGLDKCCFGRLTCMCFVFCTCAYLAQLSMFDLERRSRNTVIVITIMLHRSIHADRRTQTHKYPCPFDE